MTFIGGNDEEPDYGAYRRKLEGFLEMAREKVHPVRPDKGLDGLQSLMHPCFLRQRNLGFSDNGVLMETFELMDKNAGVIQNRWPLKEAALSFKEIFDSFRMDGVRVAFKQ